MKGFDKIKLYNNMRSAARQALISLIAVAVALAVGMAIIAMLHIDPFLAIKNMFVGALGNKSSISETFIKMTPLLFTGMSYALASRCGLTNIGMEGQLYIGALCTTIAGIYITGLPSFLHIPLCMLSGFIGGGLYGWIVGVLKVKSGASEIITTVMLNTIAINLVSYMVNGPIAEPPGQMSQSYPILSSAQLPRILPGTRAHLGILIAFVFVALFYIFLWKSKKGYEIRVSGQNERAALYSGVNTNRNILLIMLLAGGLSGLAGANEIMGIQGRLTPQISPGYGFDGIAVALIGANTPVGVIVGAVLFGILRAGGNMMQMTTGVPSIIISVIQAVVILMVVSSNYFIDWSAARSEKRRNAERRGEA
jgi:simple sugar transport system permease protein